ncbi:MAG TPA: ABC transporter ATP-binding protein [Bacteroidota bacterium]|nr:ABC transporter ATP-binding protein [Bacteroidota bacterium]
MYLSANNIHRRFHLGQEKHLAVLKGVSLQVAKGEIVAIVGPSGAGKSTLLHILGMIDRPDEGEVILDGQSVFDSKDEMLATRRNKEIGFVFQFHHLLPEFTAVENVAMPALIGGGSLSASSERAVSLLADVGLADRLHHKPSELSGGEQQRVAVARALMNSPKLILADEPSGNLDSENAAALHSMILALRQKHGQTFVIVTHNKDFSTMADRVITIVDGVVKTGG